ncbi:MAG TPA: bifunctional enoyl-CoA hydratase/phosphate acetyltransferase [Steroidobacteraceae bacterium]|nr:bifunctional enoyl-CoA hydratase/phosphate acetyltransferase [Steroidobacteraceae bacterium]
MNEATVTLESRTYDDLKPGDAVTVERQLSEDDAAFVTALARGLFQLPDGMAAGTTGYDVWAGAMFATVLISMLPGPGTVFRSQSLRFVEPVAVGDTLQVTVVVREKREADRTVLLECTATNQDDHVVVTGTAEVTPPRVRTAARRGEIPHVQFYDHRNFEELLERCKGKAPVPTAVAHPCDASSLEGAVRAARMGLIVPILVGPRARIENLAASSGLDLGGLEMIDQPHSHAAAARAVELARTGEVDLLMKGSLHTDELMQFVVDAEHGLRTARRVSHIFVMDVPTYPKLLFVTDAAVNIFPTLRDKVDICQNAIDLAQALGVERPKVAILSAVETVTDKIPSTLDAAALCKMADRGQITGAELDGPLAMDNAISMAAARTKGIRSTVAGEADVLLVPDLEAGNMLAKNLSFMANAESAGVVVGARVPIILTSRADSVRARLASCAIAALLAHERARPRFPA